ncbi:hypothetical protein PGT21_010307 [Puccinia graminis f. sp. tritici]|uniref:RNase H type-1 domain-containing protein n=1 Tax=Puccinia graminis f. sp. tritici TaxID=56615 RepID=A0A5B0LSD3_PUCGR|nr:hypothetical protein PGTUg99_029654 [Puccinia graminis f. sp. tritici]KAA1071515.1 hypothetical protein PGT21_010307 [Puccinia graminis f. sp. tritici]
MGSTADLLRPGGRLIILTDSQAAIDRLKNPRAPKSGQYILSQIQDAASAIPASTRIVIRWCPGHVGVLGNELADRKAAEARKASPLDNSIKGSITAKKATLIRREKIWKGSPRVEFPIQSAIHQLRSGHVFLNAFQFKCRRVPYYGSPGTTGSCQALNAFPKSKTQTPNDQTILIAKTRRRNSQTCK